MFEALIARGFQVQFLSHAAAILGVDFPAAIDQLEQALLNLTIPIEEIVGSGGGEAKGTQRLRHSLDALGWRKMKFLIEKTINGIPRESISHEVDHVQVFSPGVVAVEIEWNNKDPFFDRDLENFKRLHAEGAISVGVIITRGEGLQQNLLSFVRSFAEQRNLTSIADLQNLGLTPTPRQVREILRRSSSVSFPEAWSSAFIQDKYGAATTHWRKLEDRVRRGVGNPCPLLLIGLPASIITFNEHLNVEAIVAGEEPPA